MKPADLGVEEKGIGISASPPSHFIHQLWENPPSLPNSETGHQPFKKEKEKGQ